MDNMSDLQRAFVKAKLAKLPPEAPLIFDENDEDAANEASPTHLDDDSSSASSASSAGTIVPSPRKNLFARPTGYV
jgi:protein phosphatase methylesterase 1